MRNIYLYNVFYKTYGVLFTIYYVLYTLCNKYDQCLHNMLKNLPVGTVFCKAATGFYVQPACTIISMLAAGFFLMP